MTDKFMDTLKDICDDNPALWDEYHTFQDDLRTVLALFKIIDINSHLPEDSKIDIPDPMLQKLRVIAERYHVDDWKKTYFLIKLHLHQFVPQYGTESQRQNAVAHAASITGLLNEFEFWLAITAAKNFVPSFFDDSVELAHMECEGSC